MVARHTCKILVAIKKILINNKNMLGAILPERFYRWPYWLLVVHFHSLLIPLVCPRLKPGSSCSNWRAISANPQGCCLRKFFVRSPSHISRSPFQKISNFVKCTTTGAPIIIGWLTSFKSIIYPTNGTNSTIVMGQLKFKGQSPFFLS